MSRQPLSDAPSTSHAASVDAARTPNALSAVLAMLRRVVASARDVTHADAAAILLYDRAAERFVPVVPSVAVGLDERWLQRQGLEASQSLAQQAVATQDVVVVLNTASTPDLDFPLLAGGHRPGAVAAAPLTVEGAVVGTLSVFYAAPCTTDVDREALRALADLAALAITVARTQDQERALLSRLQALDRASSLVTADLEPARILRNIVEVATELVGARYGALGIAGDDGYLTDFITVGLTAEERAALGPLPRGHGLLGVLIREGQPVRLPDIRRDPRRIGFPPHHPPMTSLLGVPIRVRGAVVGDLYLTDKIGAPEFTAEDQQVIELLATHAGIAIHNAQLYAREQHAHTLLQKQTATLREQAQLIELAHDAILVRDLESRVVQWNGGAVELYGWIAEEARGQVTHTLLQTRFPVSLQEVERELERSGRWEGELEHTRRDGARIAVESRHVLLRDAAGQPMAILEINREITQRKRAEAALRLLADSGTLLETTLDEEAVLASAARLAVPGLADYCAILLCDAADAGMLRRRVVAHREAGTGSARVSVRDRRYPVSPDADRGLAAVTHTGQPALVAPATDAELVAVAADAAHLAHLRAVGDTSCLLVPLSLRSQVIGVIALVAAESGRHYSADDLALAQDLARRAALALANARLHRQVQELTTLRERERIGRDLHDGIIQDLYALTLQLEAATEDIAEVAHQERLQALGDQLRGVMHDVRRYIQGLPAAALQERPLAEALQTLVREGEGRGELAVACTVEGAPVALPPQVESALLHIAREALSNVVKHAQAHQAHVRLVYGPEAVEVTVGDDGRGFDADAVQGAEHHGLRNLRARAAEAGGFLKVQSIPGRGTTIQVMVAR